MPHSFAIQDIPDIQDIQDIQELDAGNGPLILPGSLAARIWRAEAAALARKVPADQKALAWSEWTESLWSHLLLNGVDDRIPLNRVQEEHLWAEILTLDPPPGGLSPAALPELARLVRTGLQRAAQYRVVPQLRAAADTADARLFARWVDAFLQRCERDRTLAPALLEQELARHLRAAALPCPPSLQLVGPSSRTPAQLDLLAALGRAGCAVTTPAHAISEPRADARLAATLPSEGEELRLAVRLIARHSRASAAHTFALISPEPERHRPLLEPLFRELLAPELGSVFADLSSAPWHFAAQPSLRSLPAIGAALDLLRWLAAPLPMERIDQLLVSPFFEHGAPPEALARCRAQLLRHVLRPSLDLSSFLARLRPAERSSVVPALRTLAQAAEQARLNTGRRSPADWAEQVRRLLRIVGWPGARTLSALEYGGVEAWEAVLDRLATLGIHNALTDFRSMLQLLAAEAGEQTVPTPYLLAPVQVIALAEAEGLRFDLAVVVGASEKNLPAAETRHPLLPQDLQRSLGVGDPARERARAADALGRLAQRCGRTVLLASPSGEGAEAQLSPLAATLGFNRLSAADLLPSEPAVTPVPLETIQEAEPLPALPCIDIPGGAEVLRLQAACGFRAFTALRLGAEEAPAGALGLTPRDSGSVLHTALQSLWGELGSQAALRALTTQGRETLTRNAAAGALARLRSGAGGGDPWSAVYLDVLEERFSALLLRWLGEELKRSPFRIRAQEDEQVLTLGPVRVHLRRDRVDEIDGGIALIDYKTSSALSCDHWLEERPDAPQLPAYALAVSDPETLRAIAFAQIRPGPKEFGWISVSDRPDIFPRNKRNQSLDLSAQLGRWRTELTSLAEAFARGDARVQPKAYPGTCQFCAFRSICRLDAATLLEQPPERGNAAVEEQPVG